MSGTRRFTVDVAWNMASLAFVGVGGILANLLIVSVMGAGALGVFNLAFAVYIVASQIAVGGVQYSVISHLAREDNQGAEAPALLSSALVIVTFLSSVVAALVAVCAPLIAGWMNSPDLARGLWWIAPGLVFFALNKTLLMAVNARRHMKMFAVFQSLRYALILGSLAALVVAGDASWLPLSLTVAECVLFLCLVPFVVVRVGVLSWRAVSGEWVRRHVHFGVRGCLTGVLGEMNTRIDVLMLGLFVSDAMVGVYSFVAMLAEGFAQLSYVVRQNVDPLLGAHFGAGKIFEFPEHAKRIRRKFVPAMFLFGLVLVVVYFSGCWLLKVPAMWESSGWVLAILVAGLVINATYRPFMGHMILGGKPEWNTGMILVLVLANVVLNGLLITHYGLWGAATATAVVVVAEALLIRWAAWHLWKIRL